ncbi:transforming growth factor beta receptor type 3-like [Uloborus diversus]|uniref:transforming growth factor beta receptor type 3-like n=1 Tax=Uloborus diversus TaxID=327109 RepID=UPI00240949F4|nr:transforming growth factor beta receptor type 3-like [Uloborus diversus]
MTICFALTLVLVYSIMCLSVQDNIENFNGCKVEQYFHSTYVMPVVEEPTEVVGCQSSDTASGTQEVYVLSLGSPLSGDSPTEFRKGYFPSVTLDVRPRWKQKAYSPTTVVILYSEKPVIWQMNLNHIGNSTNFHIIVNKPSQVVPSMKASVSRQKFPSIERLPMWIKSRYGIITSFSFMPRANEITLFMGTDIHAAPGCNFSSQAKSVNVKANFVQPLLASGCSVNNSHHQEKNIYVIELNSSILSSDVLVNIQQHRDVESSQNIEQNLILILKCHTPTEWVIQSSGIEGSITIIAEYPVHVQTNPLYITAIVQEKVLPADTSALLKMVQNSFGFIDNFMKTSKANKVNVAVKGKTKSKDNNVQTNESSSNGHLPLSTENLATGASSLKSTVEYPEAKNSKKSISSSLAKQMTVNCFAGKMSVAFAFDETMSVLTPVMGPHHKLPSVTLMDGSCKADMNETHIVLKTSWNECGTKSVSNRDGLAYYNQVQFITAKYSSGKTSSDGKPFPADDDDYISEDGSGSDDVSSMRQKHHHEERIIYPLPFFCSHLVDFNKDFSTEKFELNVFTKKDFQNRIRRNSFPFDVVVHDHLFAEAEIKADPRLCIIVDECWLSENDGFSREIGKKNTLIKQGCATDLSAEIMSNSHCDSRSSTGEHYKLRFSFQLSEDFISQHLFLHCRFTSCAMRDSQYLKVKECIHTENFCLKQSLRPFLDTLRGNKFTILSQGPFHIVSKLRVEKGKDPLSFAIPESSSSPENFVVDYSFDKLTGNNKKNPVSQQLVFIGLSTEAVVGIAFASFIIGAGLMATLWLIHMHTEPSRRSKQSRKQSSKPYPNDSHMNFEPTDCADSSAPCSMKPMSVHICS